MRILEETQKFKNAFSKQVQGVIKKIFFIRVLGLLIGNGPGFDSTGY
jgi:hypothetical protein